MDNDDTWFLVMMADSALPTGGFVGSAGLEAAALSGHISTALNTREAKDDPTSLHSFVVASTHSLAASSLPYAVEAFNCVSNSADELDTVIEQLIALDKGLEAQMCCNHVARRASRAQGAGYLTLLEKGLIDQRNRHFRLLNALRKEVRRSRAPGHLAITFGMACYIMNMTIERMKFLFLFQHARSIASAAVRMNLLGPFAGQKLLANLRKDVMAVLQTSERRWARLRARHELISEPSDLGDRDMRYSEGLGTDNADSMAEGDLTPVGFARALDATLVLDRADSYLSKYAKAAAQISCQTAPVLDVVQGLHDRLYSRLFNS